MLNDRQEKRTVSVCVDPETHDKFKELTKKGGRFSKVNLSNAVNNMIKDSVKFMEDAIKNGK